MFQPWSRAMPWNVRWTFRRDPPSALPASSAIGVTGCSPRASDDRVLAGRSGTRFTQVDALTVDGGVTSEASTTWQHSACYRWRDGRDGGPYGRRRSGATVVGELPVGVVIVRRVAAACRAARA